MKELLRTTDIVLVSYLEARLRDAGIEPLVLDAHMSIMEGSLSILPRRLMVADDEIEAARAVLDAVKTEAMGDGAAGADGAEDDA